MASSSVSQDDIDNDFEKNNRRSRIRTARARQINPSGCRLESNQAAIEGDIEAVDDSHGGLPGAVGGDIKGKYDKLVTGVDETAEHETSPKPIIRAGKEKRPNKMHHGNKGKQQRDRRKLREKRRSTGVVHLASTESTGGSTTGDDEESSDQQPSIDRVLLETRRNTQQNESIANSYRQAQEKLGWSSSNHADQSPSGGSNNGSSSLYPPPPPSSSSSRRDKSPSDLEADDENDHDSLNQSETGSNLSLSAATSTNTQIENQQHHVSVSSSSTPVVARSCDQRDDVDRVTEENKRLQSLLEERDKRIHNLEFKLQQLMVDTRTTSEENATLKRALSALTASASSTSTNAPASSTAKETKK